MEPPYPQIDFDDASVCWRRNKVYAGNGYFRYKCEMCDEIVHWYTTSHVLFEKFASPFDKKHQHHPNRFVRCETHLLE